MTVPTIEKNLDDLTMTVTTEFEATVERLWRIWEDPRQLERWWGPPGYPAMFVDHDLSPGSKVTYYMTGPEGEKYHGWWRILSSRPPHQLEFEDGFADDSGDPNPDMPITMVRVTLASVSPTTTSMTIVSKFPSLEAMEELAAMGMEEGLTAALGQIDSILEE
ncbi:MAG: SRPBCC domain-containing protein [Acidimicrobiia bacterium]|nr:SRPBCC domain-containing protein [Acidimicrobiia bacterium]